MSLPNFFYPQAAIGGDEAAAEPYFENDQYAAQEKLDGVRMVLHKDLKGNVRLYSRRISKKTGAPALNTEQLQHIADSAKRHLQPGTVLDGEVVAPGEVSVSNLVTKVTGSLPARAKEVQEKSGYLIYKAFDCLAYKGNITTSEPYLHRDALLLDMLIDVPYIEKVPMFTSTRMKRKLYEDVVARNGEGLIFKDTFSAYYEAKRDKSWVKLKRERTWDVVFMGIELAKAETVKKGDEEATASRIAGKAGAIRFGQYVEAPLATDRDWAGNQMVDFGPMSMFTAAGVEGCRTARLTELGTCSGFDDAMREDITQNAEVYTQQKRVFEVKAQQQFATGALRHPRFVRFRDDKQATECIFRPDEG